MKKKISKIKVTFLQSKNDVNKNFKAIYSLIKKENSYSILSKLNKKLIIDYLKITVQSKKLFLFIVKFKKKVIGYSLFAKNERDLIGEFKEMRFKIFIYLLLKLKIISIFNIFIALTKIDMLFSNNSHSKDTLNLNLLAIKSEFQSKGLGKVFLDKSIKILSEKGTKFKYISCEAPTIRAVEFYKKNNFKLLGKKIRLFNSLFLLKRKYEN